VPGNLGVRILQRDAEDASHFITLSTWGSMDAVRRFAGADVERAKYYPEDEGFLLEFEPTVQHYEIVGGGGEG
jgi:heme-degrading monooxygenase HmoA